MIFELMDIKNINITLNKILPLLLYKNFFLAKHTTINFFFYYNNFFNLYTNLNKKITIIKNTNKNVLNLTLFFKRKFAHHKFIFKNKFKFNFFLYLINFKKIKKPVYNFLPFQQKTFLPSNYLFLKNYFRRNWFFLIGGMLSPFFWDLQPLKKLTKTNTFNIFKKNKFQADFSKKIYLSNFFYFNNITENSNNTNFSLKINFNSYKNHFDYLIKFNLYFNSSYYFKKSYFYAKSLIFILYKNYFKIFNIFKKNNFKFKIWNNFWFQKFSSHKTHLSFNKKFFYNFLIFNTKKYIYHVSNNFSTIEINKIKQKSLLHMPSISKKRKYLSFKLFIFKINKLLSFCTYLFPLFLKNNLTIFNNKIWLIRNIHNNTKILLIKKTNTKILLIKKTNNFLKNFRISALNYVYFITKTETNLILYNYSFLYLTNTFYKSNLIYDIKKNMYTFINKNEIEKLIIKRYQKNNLISNISIENNYSGPLFNNFIITKNIQNKLNNTQGVNSSWLFFKKITPGYNDFSLKRIKFKPGYMNIWRESREIFKRIFNISFKYQHRLTAFFLKFNKFNNFKTFLINEMSLENILIKSRLFLDLKTTNLFIQNGLIFLNGLPCFNKNFQLYIGDFIQLIINLKYYILFRWFLNWSLKTKIKLKNKIISKMSSPLTSDEKQKSYFFSKWILQNKNLIGDVSKYLEVDYFTLSIFIIYEPFLWHDLNLYSNYSFRYNTINLYNWKYIT